MVYNFSCSKVAEREDRYVTGDRMTQIIARREHESIPHCNLSFLNIVDLSDSYRVVGFPLVKNGFSS